MKRLLLIALLLAAASGLSACQTMKGLGEDVQTLGEKIERGARDCDDGCND
jgi:predicted small secreted protein